MLQIVAIQEGRSPGGGVVTTDRPTFLHHPTGHGELGRVVGSSKTFDLPGVFLGCDELLAFLDGHLDSFGPVRLSHLGPHPLDYRGKERKQQLIPQ